MKNKFYILIVFFLFFFKNSLLADNLSIEARDISINKNNETSIFEKDVLVRTENNSTIKAQFAEYNKKLQFLILKENVKAIDENNNIIQTEYAEYDEKKKLFKSKGKTKIITSENYIIEGENIFLDDKKGIIKSSDKTIITDTDNNKIYLENFEYQTSSNIFKSIGLVNIIDKMENSYEFSQLYIDTKKKEMLGTDIKAFLNQEDFKINKKNKPRIFANTLKLNKDFSSFSKSIFTLCDYRKNDKCPPWTIQSSKMLHDNKKKTIYYDNAVVKVYDIPIFYFPKLSHPDPTVDRRSGFLPPSYSDTKNLGSGVFIPYFWAISKDKNLTITNNLYFTENPLFLGEYHQAFKNSSFLTDFGYTKGYKKTSLKKKSGEKSHFFSKFVKNFSNSNDAESSLSLSIQNVSDDKYLKLYKIKSNLVDFNTSTLESSLDFTHQDEDMFLGFNTSIYETLKDTYNDKYEYILPELTIDKNLFSNNNFGNLDLQTNIKIHNYDTNKTTRFFINDFYWNLKEKNFDKGLNTKILGNLKNINYETKNIDLYKKDTTSEIFGALGLFSQLDLYKNINNTNHFLKPKMLIRYAPGSMRKEKEGSRLTPTTAFQMDRIDNINNLETGLSTTIGLDYNIKQNNKDFDFSLAQVISEKENKKMASKTSLDEKISDLFGSAKYEINEKVNLNYNFSIDQNYSDFNYNEIGANFNLNPIEVDFGYLQENKHIGDQEYFKTKVNLLNKDQGIFSFETKRNLVTNSSEFYNLSYEYLNDCLRAGLVYRREFYTDSELEPENSLMFKITLTPFGNINSPSFSK